MCNCQHNKIKARFDTFEAMGIFHLETIKSWRESWGAKCFVDDVVFSQIHFLLKQPNLGIGMCIKIVVAILGFQCKTKILAADD